MRRDDPLPEEFKFGCCALRRGDPPHSPSGLRNAGRRCERARSKQGFFDKRGAGASDFIERIRVRDGGRARRIVTATPIIALGATCAIWAETLARRIA